MMNALQLFETCLVNDEPLIDPFYCSDQLIISRSPDSPATDIMQTNRLILDRITACKVALEDGDLTTFDRNIEKLINLLRNDLVNFTEFTSFWPVLDVTVSLYNKLSSQQKKVFLETAVKLYLEKRHVI